MDTSRYRTMSDSDGSHNSAQERVKGFRPWHIAVLLLLVFVAGNSINTGANAEKPEEGTLRARSFVVTDEKGQERGRFALGDKGNPHLVLWNGDKSAAASLEIGDDGMPRIVVQSGNMKADMGLMEDGPVLIFSDANGNRRLVATSMEGSLTGIVLYDVERREQCTIALDRKGNPFFTLQDDKGRPRISLMVDEKGASFDLVHSDGKNGVVIQVDDHGRADAVLLNEKGEPVWNARER